jgi:hypothetical protein
MSSSLLFLVVTMTSNLCLVSYFNLLSLASLVTYS